MTNFKQEKIRDGKHLLFIRSLPCCYAGKNGPCGGDVVAAHIRIGSGAGMGQKPDDNRTIPLCDTHHRFQHDKGELWFHAAFLRDAVQLANALYRITGPEKEHTGRLLVSQFNRLIKWVKNG